MKKYWKMLLVLAAVIMLALTGCGGNAGSEPASSSGSEPASSSGTQSAVQADTETDAEETELKLLEEEPENVTPQSGTPENVTPETGTGDTESENADEAETDEGEETGAEEPEAKEGFSDTVSAISESDTPTEKDELAAYIHKFGHLPDNFITKSEAKKLGWVSTKNNLWEVAPGCSIGGDRFGNYEGLLPEASGRKYTECDVGYDGGSRDARRIVFSNDGLIYYTDDHYQSYELLYGEEE